MLCFSAVANDSDFGNGGQGRINFATQTGQRFGELTANSG